MILFYDPDCGLCQRAAEVLRRWDLDADVEPGWWEELVIHDVDLARFERAIPLVLDNGQVCYGVVAVALALKTSRRRRIRCMGRFLLWPGVRGIAERVYALIASNRWRLPGATCTLPRP